jgi:hypothetical protein
MSKKSNEIPELNIAIISVLFAIRGKPNNR